MQKYWRHPNETRIHPHAHTRLGDISIMARYVCFKERNALRGVDVWVVGDGADGPPLNLKVAFGKSLPPKSFPFKRNTFDLLKNIC